MQRRTNFQDVEFMHQEFELGSPQETMQLDPLHALSRAEFIEEELNELKEGIEGNNINEVADALVDIVVVAMGTAVQMGLPWQALWDEVHRANMAKVPVDNTERLSKDLRKPEGWIPPDIAGVLKKNGMQ